MSGGSRLVVKAWLGAQIVIAFPAIDERGDEPAHQEETYDRATEQAHIQLARDPPNASRQAELGADDVERLDAADPERDMHRYEGDVQVV